MILAQVLWTDGDVDLHVSGWRRGVVLEVKRELSTGRLWLELRFDDAPKTPRCVDVYEQRTVLEDATSSGDDSSDDASSDDSSDDASNGE